jgi:HlyD family secretion protein
MRVKEVLVSEGDVVLPGQVVAKLDVVTLDAELAEARASEAAALERLAVARASITRRKAEINLAEIEVERSRKLVEDRAGSQREYDVRQTNLKTTQAGLAEEEARLNAAQQEVEVARANAKRIQTRIDDATLTSPVAGRVLYQLAEPGEVLGPGGKALTIVNMNEVYMEIFLPSEQATQVKIGAPARVTVDFRPDQSIAGYVSFVSPEAQFTPKEVETRSEREKLMFRVKIQIPKELVSEYFDQIKTGVRGVGYVKLREDSSWPLWLDTNVIGKDLPPPKAAPRDTTR